MSATRPRVQIGGTGIEDSPNCNGRGNQPAGKERPRNVVQKPKIRKTIH